MKAATDLKQYFDFLEALRKTGGCNMWESPRVLRQVFTLLTKTESYVIFSKWAKSKELEDQPGADDYNNDQPKAEDYKDDQD